MAANGSLRYYVATTGDTALAHASAEFGPRFIAANRDARGVGIVDRPDAADIVVLFEAWSLKLQDYAEQLSRCRFLNEFAARVMVVNYDDAGTAFLPGCYTSLTPRTFDSRRHRPSCYPKAYNPLVETMAARRSAHDARWLCTFRGNTRHQPVRRRILAELAGAAGFRITDPGIVFHAHDQASHLQYLEEIAESDFVLCPRGESPSTYRLFEVMQMGRCPVIIADDWLPIAGVDWDGCSVRIRERDLANVPRLLGGRRHEARALGERARTVWELYFGEETKFRLYAAQLAELHAIRAASGGNDLESLRRHWRSREFRWQRGWTLPQRLWRAPRRAARLVHSYREKATASQGTTDVKGVQS